jgi:hypothetical protein
LNKKNSYWFPAKRYGWGWGFPIKWQGWLVTIAYFILMISGIVSISPKVNLALFIGYMSFITIAMLSVCWLKGEPPRWR